MVSRLPNGPMRDEARHKSIIRGWLCAGLVAAYATALLLHCQSLAHPYAMHAQYPARGNMRRLVARAYNHTRISKFCLTTPLKTMICFVPCFRDAVSLD